MNLEFDFERLLLAQKAVRAELLAERASGGYWAGEVGSSPVATAAAVSALVLAHRQDSDDALRESATGDGQVIQQLVQGDLSELLFASVHWLARRQNEDGGWGDCDGAESNLAATLLVQAAFRLTGIPAKYADLMVRADDFVAAQGGLAGLRSNERLGKTYIASVLATCALADMVAWRQVPTLAFERHALPKRWRKNLPAQVGRTLSAVAMAVGLSKFQQDPPHNPVTRLVRRHLRKKTLATLERLQAADDSYLASPLWTAFVVIGVAGADCQEHRIAQRGIEFLLSSVRADASWAVMTSRATINTAVALESLLADQVGLQQVRAVDHLGGEAEHAQWGNTATAHDTVADVEHQLHTAPEALDVGDASRAGVEWLLTTQRNSPSELTEAPAGGWGASDAAGDEPNTIATASVLLTLANANRRDGEIHRGRIERAARHGVSWLLNMQNEDGGWPTYSRDDSSQPLEASGVDPTSVALRALSAWQQLLTAEAARIGNSVSRGVRYLESRQQEDGSFLPLWWGNERQHEVQNPVIGTAQVLSACIALQQAGTSMATRATNWLLTSQHTAGGWGPPRAPIDYSESERDGNLRSWRENDTLAEFCSVEETSAVVAALLPLAAANPAVERSVSRGLKWLANAMEQDEHRRPATIGSYFSRIWYHDRLLPLAWAVGALSRAVATSEPAKTAISPVA